MTPAGPRNMTFDEARDRAKRALMDYEAALQEQVRSAPAVGDRASARFEQREVRSMLGTVFGVNYPGLS